MEKSIRMFVLGLSLLLTAIFVQTITQTKLAKLDQTALFVTNDVVTIKDRERQLDCLARNIYHEAGYEPFEGKVAVAQVTMNRASDSRFPSDVCGVVFQKNIFMEKVVCQFSWYCESATMTRPRNMAAFKESEMVARQVLLEGFRLPSLQKALYFHATHINPKWR